MRIFLWLVDLTFCLYHCLIQISLPFTLFVFSFFLTKRAFPDVFVVFSPRIEVLLLFLLVSNVGVGRHLVEVIVHKAKSDIVWFFGFFLGRFVTPVCSPTFHEEDARSGDFQFCLIFQHLQKLFILNFFLCCWFQVLKYYLFLLFNLFLMCILFFLMVSRTSVITLFCLKVVLCTVDRLIHQPNLICWRSHLLGNGELSESFLLQVLFNPFLFLIRLLFSQFLDLWFLLFFQRLSRSPFLVLFFHFL